MLSLQSVLAKQWYFLIGVRATEKPSRLHHREILLCHVMRCYSLQLKKFGLRSGHRVLHPVQLIPPDQQRLLFAGRQLQYCFLPVFLHLAMEIIIKKERCYFDKFSLYIHVYVGIINPCTKNEVGRCGLISHCLVSFIIYTKRE